VSAAFASARARQNGTGELAAGALHVPSWLTRAQQQWILGRFGEWASGPVPVRAAWVRGREMPVRTVCLAAHAIPRR